MKIERSSQRELTPADQAHLAKLRQLVQDCLADGKISQAEIQSIREFIHADAVVTFEELEIINATVKEVLGDLDLDYDWD